MQWSCNKKHVKSSPLDVFYIQAAFTKAFPVVSSRLIQSIFSVLVFLASERLARVKPESSRYEAGKKPERERGPLGPEWVPSDYSYTLVPCWFLLTLGTAKGSRVSL